MKKQIDYSKITKVVTITSDDMTDTNKAESFDEKINKALNKYVSTHKLINVESFGTSRYETVITQLFFGDKE